MTTKLLIDRELLERIDESAICDGTDATISDDLFTQLVAALAAPRQPEGELKPDRNKAFEACPDTGCDWGSFWQGWKAHHADAQRAIAELRAECERLRQQLAERDAQIASMRAEVTPFIETHWRPVERQRDKLADLLADVKADYTNAIYWEDMHAVMKRIDAALAEIEG